MTKHDFTALYERYPAIVAGMPDTFNSHQFILELAHQNQVLYIEALYAYRDSLHRGEPTPFRAVHQILSQHLADCPDLVERIGDADSHDIFGQPNGCAEWRRI
ncbi:MAG: hypothetical protein JXA89_17145 [Anaerolineae bacterium]|nr:hypothetical protein [Anaerolineae bacterium]